MGKGSGLAERFRRAILAEREARKQEEVARQQRLEAARQAREQLLDELCAFAEATGFLGVERAGEQLVFLFSGRRLAFVPQGDADRVVVQLGEGDDEEEHVLYRQAELGDKWVWSARRGRREDRLPLFDAGLEELLVRGLGLPRP